jgi:hypothetical protein
MDLRGGCGTIIVVTRWILVLVFAVGASIVGAPTDAEAQAFKPKRSTPVKGAPAKKAPVSAKKSSPKRVVTSKPSKKRSRAAQGKGRTSDLTPDDDDAGSKSASKDDDFVLIVDDDE